MHSLLSFIAPEEEQEAIDFVAKQLKFPVPNMAPYYMAVKLHIKYEETEVLRDKDGVEKRVFIPETISIHEKFKSCVALVVSQGERCFKGKKFSKTGPWCRVGDWIVIPRNDPQSRQFRYRGIPMQFMQYDKLYCVIEDPSYVTRDVRV